jgi:hypothetical protein
MDKLKPQQWRIGRLRIIRYVLHNETLVGVIFAHEHGYRRSLEVMVGRSNYVFYIDSR